MGECPPSWIEKKFAPELRSHDCFATGVTRQTLLILRKMCNFNVNFSKIFWGLCPQTSILGRGYGAPPQTDSTSSPALRSSLGTFGPSIVVSPRLQKSWLRAYTSHTDRQARSNRTRNDWFHIMSKIWNFWVRLALKCITFCISQRKLLDNRPLVSTSTGKESELLLVFYSCF